MNQILNTLKTKYEANREEYKSIRGNIEQLSSNGINSMTKEEWLMWDRYIKATKILDGEAMGLKFAFDEIVKSIWLNLDTKTIITIRKEEETVVFTDNIVTKTTLMDFVMGKEYSEKYIIGYIGENNCEIEVRKEEITIENWVIEK